MSNIESFKVVVIGDAQIGKTCLVKRFIEGGFNPGEMNTLGAQFYAKKVKAEYTSDQNNVKKTEIKLQLWDTAGEERFKSLTSIYYKDAQAIIIAFSITSLESFENLRVWMDAIEDNVTLKNIIIVLAGLKDDAEDH